MEKYWRQWRVECQVKVSSIKNSWLSYDSFDLIGESIFAKLFEYEKSIIKVLFLD